MPSQHIIKRFDEELAELKEMVLSMGGQVERAMDNAVKSMLEQDEKLAKKTIKRDKTINALEVNIDELCRDIMVRRQPAAGDLRFIMGIIKIVTDLERMGDLSEGIAEGMLRIKGSPPTNFLNLGFMAKKVKRQIERALNSFSFGDADLAMKIIEKDDGIDELYRRMYREVLSHMKEEPEAITNLIILSNAAKNLERIADHATNIAEMVIYIERGHDIRHVDQEAAARIMAGEEEA